ncbi:MAG: Gfo/Idh/MocA family oxidoreductase, partial [Gammaproteobacteria bacterium]|nr:Gfo/Idh/MocA family oxidoreductase [Gammaproteobacteria bacterium]
SGIDGVGQLIDLCMQRDLRLMTGYNLRFLTTLISFREFIHQGKIGRVHSVHAEVGQYLPGWRPDVDYRKTVSAQKRLGGGVLLELSHEIDYMLWLFGKVDWVKATVLRQSSLQIDVEDTAYLQLGFNSDDTVRQVVATLNMDFVRRDTTRQCAAVGDSGTLRWDGVAGSVKFLPAESNQWEELLLDKPERDFTYQQEIEHFISCVETGADPVVGGRDGKAVLSVIDAARVSSRTGQAVYL